MTTEGNIDDVFSGPTKKAPFGPKLAAADQAKLYVAMRTARDTAGVEGLLYFYRGNVEGQAVEGPVVYLGPKEVRIGRRKDEKNDVVVEDPGVSAHHCRVYREGTGYWIAECTKEKLPTNGTFVNGSKVLMKQQLSTGDVVAIGDTRAYYAHVTKP